jgi:hypothetical protein
MHILNVTKDKKLNFNTAKFIIVLDAKLFELQNESTVAGIFFRWIVATVPFYPRWLEGFSKFQM